MLLTELAQIQRNSSFVQLVAPGAAEEVQGKRNVIQHGEQQFRVIFQEFGERNVVEPIHILVETTLVVHFEQAEEVRFGY
eukprot:CAMPEP_0170176540 /NCGR_PEP_ID=MMETSP0040_2-20121228/9398_1 /TAXON_ID=641309 /ORGANISM="Lotharella oceanica, Strain CCMP622" /LENGTH=79 /DNA_ID=CAMNT_0010418899 /DNA_START=355 /DNA_END=594 /DNA_ORIENTATION=+